jgi:hypothetical protein
MSVAGALLAVSMIKGMAKLNFWLAAAFVSGVPAVIMFTHEIAGYPDGLFYDCCLLYALWRSLYNSKTVGRAEKIP